MNDVVADAMERAGGDVDLALELLAGDVVGFTWVIEGLEHDKKIMSGTIEYQSTKLEAEEPGFLTRLSNSSVFKVGLVLGGIWLGQEMVKVK